MSDTATQTRRLRPATAPSPSPVTDEGARLQQQIEQLKQLVEEQGRKLASLEQQSLRPIPGYDRVVAQVMEIASNVDVGPEIQRRIGMAIDDKLFNREGSYTSDYIRDVAREHIRSIDMEDIVQRVSHRITESSSTMSTIGTYAGNRLAQSASANTLVSAAVRDAVAVRISALTDASIATALEARFATRDSTLMRGLVRNPDVQNVMREQVQTYLQAQSFMLSRM